MLAVVSDIESSLGFMRLLIKFTIFLFLIMTVCAFMICFKESDKKYAPMRNDIEMQPVGTNTTPGGQTTTGRGVYSQQLNS